MLGFSRFGARRAYLQWKYLKSRENSLSSDRAKIDDRKDTMQNVIRSIFVLFSLGFFTIASAQLPPEVIADKYLVQAEQLFERKDYVAALNMMDKILALQKEHNITLLDEFHFKYAQIAFSVGSIQIALDAVSKYLSAGRGREFYKEALALLIEIEEIEEELEKELGGLQVTPENMCEGKPVGSRCWMALTDQPECYVWNPNLQKDETVTWSGVCSDGFAQGAGTRLRNYSYNPYEDRWDERREEAMGYLQNGYRQGLWTDRISTLTGGITEQKGPYVNSKRHGLWVERWPDIYSPKQAEGAYVAGKKHGKWVTHESDGSVGGGAYVDGKKQGQWIEPYPGGQGEGSYVGGKRHGHWIWRGLDGTTETETYVNGRSLGKQ